MRSRQLPPPPDRKRGRDQWECHYLNMLITRALRGRCGLAGAKLSRLLSARAHWPGGPYQLRLRPPVRGAFAGPTLSGGPATQRYILPFTKLSTVLSLSLGFVHV